MRWRVHFGIGGVLVFLGLASGCGGDRNQLLADDNNALLEAIAQAGLGDPSPLSRAQKPDQSRTSPADLQPLNVRPVRPPEVSNAPAAARIGVTVNGQAILDEEIRSACYPALQSLNLRNLPERERQQKIAETLREARDHLVDRELIMQDMEQRLGANKNAEKALQHLREAASKEFDSWERKIRESQHFQELRMRWVRGLATPTTPSRSICGSRGLLYRWLAGRWNAISCPPSSPST